MQSIVKGKAEYRVLENFYFVGMVGLIKEELVEKRREEMVENRERRKVEHRVLENFYYVFFFVLYIFLKK